MAMAPRIAEINVLLGSPHALETVSGLVTTAGLSLYVVMKRLGIWDRLEGAELTEAELLVDAEPEGFSADLTQHVYGALVQQKMSQGPKVRLRWWKDRWAVRDGGITADFSGADLDVPGQIHRIDVLTPSYDAETGELQA